MRVRPRDAASLLIHRPGPDGPQFLMGRRSAGHLFMPGHLVFPGGRLDPGDLSLARSFSIRDEHLRILSARTRQTFGDHRAVALALAAIRETFEETGAMVAHGAPFASAAPYWRDFAAAGQAPAPDRLVPFARAITPPVFPRRFDTRFFLVSHEDVRLAPTGPLPTDEFDMTGWFGASDFGHHTIAAITRAVLDVALSHIARPRSDDAPRTLAFLRPAGGSFRIEPL